MINLTPEPFQLLTPQSSNQKSPNQSTIMRFETVDTPLSSNGKKYIKCDIKEEYASPVRQIVKKLKEGVKQLNKDLEQHREGKNCIILKEEQRPTEEEKNHNINRERIILKEEQRRVVLKEQQKIEIQPKKRELREENADVVRQLFSDYSSVKTLESPLLNRTFTLNANDVESPLPFIRSSECSPTPPFLGINSSNNPISPSFQDIEEIDSEQDIEEIGTQQPQCALDLSILTFDPEDKVKEYSKLLVKSLPTKELLKEWKWKINHENCATFLKKINKYLGYCGQFNDEDLFSGLETEDAMLLEKKVAEVQSRLLKLADACVFYTKACKGIDSRFEFLFAKEKDVNEELLKYDLDNEDLEKIKGKLNKYVLCIENIKKSYKCFSSATQTVFQFTCELQNDNEKLLKEHQKILDLMNISFPENSSFSSPLEEPRKSLNKMIKKLENNEFTEALKFKENLSQTFCFPISEKEFAIKDLIDRHLYRIHLKDLTEEERTLSIKEWEYGKQVFEYKHLATDTQRKRAIYCAALEMELAQLLENIENKSLDGITESFEALQKVALDVADTDSIQNIGNNISGNVPVVDHLYDQILEVCLKAKEEENLLEGHMLNDIDPEHLKFDGKFGFYAFQSAEFFPYMQEAVRGTIEALKKDWTVD